MDLNNGGGGGGLSVLGIANTHKCVMVMIAVPYSSVFDCVG